MFVLFDHLLKDEVHACELVTDNGMRYDIAFLKDGCVEVSEHHW